MKIQATGYTFNATAKTISFSGLVPASLESILHVANATTGTLLFQPQAGPLFTGTWSSPVLTLACSTTGMANGDRLLIFVDDGAATTAVSDGGGSLTVDGPLTDGQLRATALPVSASALPLPSGAATAAAQTTGNSSLSSIDGKMPALVSGRQPVDGSGVTQPVSGTFWQATQPISGTITANAGTNLNTSALALETGGNLATILGRLPANLTVTSTRLLVDGSGATQPVSGTFWQATQPVSAASLPLPTGAASETTLAAVNGKLPALDSGRLPVVLPPGGGGLTDTELRATPVPVIGTNPAFMRAGFAEVGSGIIGKAAEEFSLLQTGSGMTVNQSAGNLVITTGTTVNSETVIRSIDTFTGSLLARLKVILSQRIVNQTFRFELADLIGEALSYTINSATSITVTFPSVNPFTAANVGQSVRLSRITGAAGIPGRFAIASISGLTVNFTVAAWPASGSGTLTLYGWNYIQLEYSGATATNASFDAQRRGWNSGNTTITTQTSASPGHVAQLNFDVFTAGVSDALVASNTAYQWANRGSRIENVPDPDTVLYLFIVVQNGSTAPASTTTLTTGFVQVEDQGRQKIRVASSDPVGSHALPVQVLGGVLATQPVSGTVTANIGTGAIAAGTNAIGDVGQQYRANNTGAGTVTALTCPATPAVQTIKGTAGRLLGLYLVNTNATIRYIKIYNATAPTLASTAAAMRIPLPQNQPVFINFEGGMGFATAITCAITATASITDSTGAVTIDDVTGFSVHA